jgi:hypothetical protein
MCPYFPYHNNRTTDKSNVSLAKSANSTEKSDDNTTKLEQTITHMAKMMKDEREDGDNGIWMNEEDWNPSNPLVIVTCFHVDVEE